MKKRVIMKSKVLIVLNLCLGLALLPGVSFAKGGKDGGGGSVRGSSDAEILKAIQAVASTPTPKELFKSIFEDQYRYNLQAAFIQLIESVFDKKKIEDPKLMSIFKKMYGNFSPGSDFRSLFLTDIFEDIRNTTVIPQVMGCSAKNSQSDTAASTLLRKGAPICISIEKLRGIPIDALPIQIQALLAHEFAHHFSFGEEEAKMLQNFFLYRRVGFIDRDEVKEKFETALVTLERRVRHLKDTLETFSEGTSDEKICFELGQFWTYVEGCGSNQKLSDWTRRFAGFCGIDKADPGVAGSVLTSGMTHLNDMSLVLNPLEKGDRADLIHDLTVFEKDLLEFGADNNVTFGNDTFWSMK